MTESPFAPPKTEIPFQLYRGYLIVVQGSLGGVAGTNFLVDTGADPSVVDGRVAQKLHLAGVPSKLALVNKNVVVQRTVLPSLQIGPVHKESLPVLVRDLVFLEKALGVRIDAVIGFDVLSLSNFSIDYGARRIVFGPVEPSVSAVPFETGPPFITVQMEVQHVTIRLLVDTGSSDLLLFQSRIRDRLPQLVVVGEKTSSNMAGHLRLKQVLLSRVHLGDTDFGQQKAFLVQDQEDEGRGFDGLMGIRALGIKQIAFDFRHRSLSWKR